MNAKKSNWWLVVLGVILLVVFICSSVIAANWPKVEGWHVRDLSRATQRSEQVWP